MAASIGGMAIGAPAAQGEGEAAGAFVDHDLRAVVKGMSLQPTAGGVAKRARVWLAWGSLTLAGVMIQIASAAGAQPTVLPVANVGQASFGEAVERAVSDYIIPSYEQLQDATEDLTRAMDALCSDPTPATKDAVASAFAQTVSAWARVDFLRFGPMAAEGRLLRFTYWPDVHRTGARQLAQFLKDKDARLLEPGALERQSAAVQGFPALEALLFLGDEALLKADPPGEFRCNLASAVARNMNAMAAVALDGWTTSGGWHDIMQKPGPDNRAYATQTEVMTELLKAILTAVEQDGELKLAPALGATPQEAGAGRAPFAVSGLTMRFLIASVEATRAFVEASGILKLLPSTSNALGPAAEALFSKLTDGVNSAGPDFGSALVDPAKRGLLLDAVTSLRDLRNLFQEKIASALGISPGFNSLDGD